METDYPEAYEKGKKILDSMTSLCEKHDKSFRRLTKAEQGWLLTTLMTYVRIDIKSSEIVEWDSRLLASFQAENEELLQENNKLKQQLEEMRHYA